MSNRFLSVALIAVAGSVAAACAPPSAHPVSLPGVVARVIDGDTVVMGDGQHVRLIGMDTPESGQPCYAESTAALSAMALGHTVALLPGARDDVDHYGRLLRYVDGAGVDFGLEMIKQGWAVARYDSRDGYGWHPREASYVAADAVSPAQTCATPGGAGGGVYYANCAAVRAAGKAPLYRGQPGYASHLDGDNDGVACE